MSAPNLAAPKASFSYAKAALLSTAAVLAVCYFARRLPVVGPHADAVIKKALVA